MKFVNKINRIKTNANRSRQLQMAMALEVAAKSATPMTELHRLPFQVKELKLIGLDLSRAPDWRPIEVLHWVLSLERGTFLKYQRVLKVTILRGITGKTLLSLRHQPREIQCLGITNTKDVALFQMNLQKLARNRGLKRRFMPIVNRVAIPVVTRTRQQVQETKLNQKSNVNVSSENINRLNTASNVERCVVDSSAGISVEKCEGVAQIPALEKDQSQEVFKVQLNEEIKEEQTSIAAVIAREP